MDFTAKIILVTLLQFISTVKLTSAHYCEWGTCNSWEYCCGDNQCCGNNDILFYVTIAVCVFLAVMLLCCSVLFICNYFCRIGCPSIRTMFSNYNNLSRERESSTTNLAACDIEYDERMYSDPPPPYSEVVHIRK